jgi:hypothetical protein
LITRTWVSFNPNAAARSARVLKIPCVDSQTVTLLPLHSATAPCGSSAVWSTVGVRYSRSTMTSAALKPAATSPRVVMRGDPFAVFPFGRTSGAFGASA